MTVMPSPLRANATSRVTADLGNVRSPGAGVMVKNSTRAFLVGSASVSEPSGGGANGLFSAQERTLGSKVRRAPVWIGIQRRA